jgi:hypothetical protein
VSGVRIRSFPPSHCSWLKPARSNRPVDQSGSLATACARLPAFQARAGLEKRRRDGGRRWTCAPLAAALRDQAAAPRDRRRRYEQAFHRVARPTRANAGRAR